jgi:DNA polymerase-3 subunit delta'
MKLIDLPAHHAVLVVAHNRAELQNHLWLQVAELSRANKLFEKTVLDIDTAREIISWAQTPHGEKKIALVSFHTASHPAQNAILKILEEPPLDVRFILLTSNKEHLLDTVMSRVYSVTHDSEQNLEMAHEFLETPPLKRMSISSIVDLLARTDEEGRKDRESVREFLLSLSTVLHKKTTLPYSEIEEVIECASYSGDTSSSSKSLLEYLALRLPQYKA